jgi:hypothetical protein
MDNLFIIAGLYIVWRLWLNIHNNFNHHVGLYEQKNLQKIYDGFTIL